VKAARPGAGGQVSERLSVRIIGDVKLTLLEAEILAKQLVRLDHGAEGL
jgi:hypothetical protein